MIKKKAKLNYKHNYYEIIEEGDYVLCAISGKEILLKNSFKVIKEVIFPDHYQYTQKDINNIKLQAKNLNAKILTTEKDFVKLNSKINNDIKFLKIEIYIKDEEKLINYLKSNI